jgi:hypothetical protein
MISAVWFVVAIVFTPAGVATTVSPAVQTEAQCLEVKAMGDAKIKSKGLPFESKCIVMGSNS